jgi:ABC-type polysaccharide/polyol phosphate transport system ATPase subunit
MMNTEITLNTHAVLTDQISVHFNRSKHNAGSIKELSIQLFKKRIPLQKIKALDGISLEIQRGEVYGIIGRNGSGKSTLLRVLSRIILPTSGRIQIWGKVSPLLGVGAGFHQELTGRENAFLYSTVLGRTTARTREFIDWIVEFSELEDFIDEPIRVYSSGMVARLGFAVAMAEKPEILLVDEVLSVGDERFKDKCNIKFHELTSEGATIIFVSHNMGAVQELCSRASWINQGKLMGTGDAVDVIKEYRKSIGKS